MGSEATKNAVLTRRGPDGFKRSFRHEALVPKAAVVDPALTDTCPRDVTAACGMDALTQLIESYTSTQANPFTDSLVESGLVAFGEGFRMACRGRGVDAERGRDAMAYAALVSGIGLAQVGLGVVHGLASPLGALFPIPHSIACGALLAAAAEANIAALKSRDPRSPALCKYAKIGALLTGGSESAEGLIGYLHALTGEVGLPPLSIFGVCEADIPKIAACCSQKTNPVQLTEEELIHLLGKCLSGAG